MSLFCSGISVECASRRHHNQDEFGYLRLLDQEQKEITAAIVADGVSHCYEGKIASYNTVLWFLDWLRKYFLNHTFQWEQLANDIQSQMTIYNHFLNAFTESLNQEDTCTTVCGLVTDEKTVLFFNAGDSRAYELGKNGIVRPMTQDDVGENQHSISMHIGGKNDDDVRISFYIEQYQPECRYFLCTDGMYQKLDFSEWESEIFAASSREEAVQVLVNIAKHLQEAGEKDDMTGILIAKVAEHG